MQKIRIDKTMQDVRCRGPGVSSWKGFVGLLSSRQLGAEGW